MTVSPVTFYVDPAWRREGMAHIPLLYPFWGKTLTERTPFQKELFDMSQFDTSYYALTDDPACADMVLVPYNYRTLVSRDPELLDRCVSYARSLGKPVLLDGVGDIEDVIDLPNVFVLRYGGYRFSRSARDIIIPPYAGDLLAACYGGIFRAIEKHPMPTVCFAGWVDMSWYQTVRTLVKELPRRLYGLLDPRYQACQKGVFFRRRALRVLGRSVAVVMRTIARPSYSGHRATASDDPVRLRREFADLIVRNNYALDVRGDANASTRLFEILSLGRVPVIVDTERNFPFADQVDYFTFSIVVDFRDIDTLPERIAEFHATVTPERFVSMQHAARQAFVQYFSVPAMMPHIVRELRTRANLGL